MATSSIVPLEEYLARSYAPDCEYVDGELVERNVGEYSHSLLQTLLIEYLAELRIRSGVKFRSLVEQRVQVREGLDRERRYRVPDVMVLPPGHRRTPVTIEPPALTIEILSPEDRFNAMAAKSREYLAFGVPVAIVVDPEERTVYDISVSAERVLSGNRVQFDIEGQPLEIDFSPLFALLDTE